jgi:hypothetical protein
MDGKIKSKEREKMKNLFNCDLFKDAEAMYRLITMTGKSLIVRDVEGSGFYTIYGCIPGICVERQSKTKKNLTNSQHPGLNF